MSVRVRSREPYQIKLNSLGLADADGLAVASIRFPANAIGRVGSIQRLIASIGDITGQSVFNDQFSRTLAANNDAAIGWGTPSLGPTYQSLTALAAQWTYQTDGAQGLINWSQSIGAHRAASSAVAIGDLIFTGTLVSLTSSGALSGNRYRIVFRVQDGNNLYGLNLTFSGANAISNVAIMRRLAGANSDLATVAKVVALPAFFEITADGATLTASVWRTIDPKPAVPDVTAADLSFAIGGVGVSGLCGDAPSGIWTLDDLNVTGLGTTPQWDAYLGDVGNPLNLRDSSAPNALSRWIPNLVNGQPFYPGDELNIVAYGLVPGTQITVTTNLVLTPVP